jgi:hypothetical protein
LTVQVRDRGRVVAHDFDFLPRPRRLRWQLSRERAQERLDLLVAGANLRLVKAVGFQPLAQRKKMVLLPVTLQTRQHLGFLFMVSIMVCTR